MPKSESGLDVELWHLDEIECQIKLIGTTFLERAFLLV